MVRASLRPALPHRSVLSDQLSVIPRRPKCFASLSHPPLAHRVGCVYLLMRRWARVDHMEGMAEWTKPSEVAAKAGLSFGGR